MKFSQGWTVFAPLVTPVVLLSIQWQVMSDERKRKGDNNQHFFTPVLTSKLSVSLPSCMTTFHAVTRVPDDVDELWGIPLCAIRFHKTSLSKLSKAFSKSTKFRNKEVFHSNDCSIIIRSAAIWSVHDHSFLKPFNPSIEVFCSAPLQPLTIVRLL